MKSILTKTLAIGGTAALSLAFVLPNAQSVMAQTLDTKVTIDADDSSLPDILSILAAASGYNIVTGPGVNKKERISIHLKDTPIEQAMNLVVRAAGLSYDLVGSSFLVGNEKDIKKEVGITSKVFQLKNSQAEDIKKLLGDVTDRVQVDPIQNKVLVLASPKVLAQVTEIIEKVDQAPTQILLDSKIIEVSAQAEEEYGIDWERLNYLTTIVAENPSAIFQGNGGFVLAKDAEKSGAVTQAGLGGLPNYYIPTQTDFSSQVPIGSKPNAHIFEPIKAGSDLLPTNGYSRQLNAFDLTLDFLLNNGKAEILSDAQVSTINGRKAIVEVNDEVPYILQASGLGGQFRTRFVSVGIKLHITPRLYEKEVIETTIRPEASSIFKFVGPDGNQVPWTKVRFAETTVRMKDGQSAIIAGLLKQDKGSAESKLPYIGEIEALNEIPIIGHLFRHEAKRSDKTDLIIKVTPHVLQDGKLSNKDGEDVTGKSMEERLFQLEGFKLDDKDSQDENEENSVPPPEPEQNQEENQEQSNQQ
ncbi:hypothetical protein IT568_06765 [bacterium]|nr:hypothetical protein [bacterium]